MVKIYLYSEGWSRILEDTLSYQIRIIAKDNSLQRNPLFEDKSYRHFGLILIKDSLLVYCAVGPRKLQSTKSSVLLEEGLNYMKLVSGVGEEKHICEL